MSDARAAAAPICSASRSPGCAAARSPSTCSSALGLLLLIAVHGLGYFWQRELVAARRCDDGAQRPRRDPRARGDPRRAPEQPTRRRAHPAQDRQPRSVRPRLPLGRRARHRERAAEPRRRAAARAPTSGATSTAPWSSCGAATRCWPRGPEAVWAAFGAAARREDAPSARRSRRSSTGRSATSTTTSSSSAWPSAASRSSAPPAAERARRQAEIERAARRAADASTSGSPHQLAAMRERLRAETLVMETADGKRKEIAGRRVVRAVRPNGMGTLGASSASTPPRCGSSSPTTRANRTPRAASSPPSSAP